MKMLFCAVACLALSPVLALDGAARSPEMSPMSGAAADEILGPNTPLSPQALVRLVSIRNAAAVNARLQQVVSAKLLQAQ